MFHRKLSYPRFTIILFFLILSNLIILRRQEQPATFAQTPDDNSRVRVYDSFGNQQGKTLITEGSGRVVSIGNGYAVVDDNEHQVRLFNLFGVLQNKPIATDGRAKIIPCQANRTTILDNSSIRIYTLFGHQQGQTISTNSPADGLFIGTSLIAVENNRVRIFDLFANQAGNNISTNSRATIVPGDTGFAVIDNGRIRIYDLRANKKADINTSGAVEVKHNNNIFVVIEDNQVRIFNLFGAQIGLPIQTNGRANIAMSTDRIMIADNNRVRFFAERTGSLINSVVRKGTARLVANIQRVAVIDDGAGKRLQIYDLAGNASGVALTTSNQFDVKISIHDRFVIIEDSKIRILDPSGTPVNNNIPTSDRADIHFATELIFVTDSNQVRIFDHFGNARGDVFNTVGRANVVVNVQGLGISNNQQVRIYNHLRNVDGGMISTIGDVSLAAALDRIIILDEESDVNHAPVLNNSGNPALTTILEDAADNEGMLIKELIASDATVNMITDQDAGALEGIAVTAVNSSHGQWQFSVDKHRRRWQILNPPTRNSGRLLAADDFTRIRFVPQPDFHGSINPSITFRAWDQTSGRNGGTVLVDRTGGPHPFSTAEETASLTVTAVNDAPSFNKGANQTVRAVAGSQSIPNWATAIAAGPANESSQTVNFVVTNNNNPLFVNQPMITPAGRLTYEPAPTASGSATVTVMLSDDGGTVNGGVDQSATQTFTITVLPDDGSPVAVDDDAATDVDTAVIIPVLDNDIEPNNDPLTVTNVSTPAKGTATTDGTTVTYTPMGGFVGIDSFTYTISDGSLTDTGTVTLFVGQVNRAPELDNAGTPALAAIDEDEATNNGTLIEDVIASVLPLDMITDADGGALEGIAVIDLDEGHGDWQYSTNNGNIWNDMGSPTTMAGRLLAADGSTRLRFVPDNHFNGVVDTGVTFRAWDQSSGSNGGTANTLDNGGLTAFSINTETAAIVVNPVNDVPTAVADSANTPSNTPRTVAVLGNDSDVDGDVLTVTAVGLPDNGTSTLNADNTILYEPGGFTGTTVFTYTIQDSGNLTDTASVTVQVGVTNLAPVATDDVSETFEETAVSIKVLNNDTDTDGDTLIVSQVGVPANGTATVLNGTAVIYTPIPGFTGSDSFTYTLSDGDLTDTATVTVTVAGPGNDFWENDPFDDLNPTALHVQNGWAKARADRASAVVVAGDTPGDQILQIDPGAGQTIVMGKDVLDQTNGRHTFSVLVKVTGPVDTAEPTLAKIEFGTNANQGWGKKFQLYFGTSMRVNYGPTADDAAEFISNTVLDQWYRIQVDIDLANNLLDLSVDGSQVLTSIPMHPGPIASLGISGWDRSGAVFLDELRGWQSWDPGSVGMCGISTFDTGDEGWLVIGDAQDSSTTPDYHITGGNPGGYISATDDVLGGTWYWVAPDKFLGNQLSAYNSTLSFDLRQSLTSNQFDADDVIIAGNDFELVYDLPDNPGIGWTSYSIVLNEAEGWINRDTGDPATNFEMLTVLASLEMLHIRGEYRLGNDVGSLDNVSFNANGCPQTGQDIYWINPNGGDMAEPSNWSTNTVPTFADHAFITLSGNYTVTHQTSTHPVPMEFGSLTIGTDPVIWINADSNTNSLIHVENTLINNGRILMQNNGPSDATGFAWLVVDNGFLENNGLIDLLPGPGNDHEIFSDILNEGEFNQAAALIYSGQFINRHIVNIAENQELVISDPLEELSSFDQEDGVITGLGTLIINNQTSLNFSKGETLGPPPILSDAFLNFGPDPTGVASFILHEGSMITGNIGAEQTVIIGEEQGETASAAIDGDLTNAGVILMETDGDTAVSSLHISNGTLTNRGNMSINAGGGGSRRIQGDVQNEGIFTLNLTDTQDIDLVASQFVNASQGSIIGVGNIDVDHIGTSLTNEGVIQPGHSPGVLTINGDFEQTATGNLLIELAQPTDFDQLRITGMADLDGTLTAALLNSYEPGLGTQFEIVICNDCVGQFAQLEAEMLADNKLFTAVYNTRKVTLTVVEGDFIQFLPVVFK